MTRFAFKYPKMKKYLLLLTLICALFAFTQPAEVYKIDLKRSKVEWTARKVTGFHTGQIKVSSGQLNIINSKIAGGTIKIDMNSISCTDLKGSDALKLLGQLKSDDFFSTDNNPFSTFIITKVEYQGEDKAIITGNLIIKGVSNTLTFPAIIKHKNGIVVAVATEVKVDRTKYGIKYGSKSFIADLGDKAISNDFELDITIVAKK